MPAAPRVIVSSNAVCASTEMPGISSSTKKGRPSSTPLGVRRRDQPGHLETRTLQFFQGGLLARRRITVASVVGRITIRSPNLPSKGPSETITFPDRML